MKTARDIDHPEHKFSIADIDTKRAKGLVQLIVNLQQKIYDLYDPESNLIKKLANDEAKHMVNAIKDLEHINKRLRIKVEIPTKE